ncbi:hypothetical protein [Bacillus horti]|uniref:Uncharacterized protein n=1 Tax=Caldalkalibacillus horti TaxID=77523 RepID=A0ABT9VZV8_9BACI|nr:hypothetical protein [Bacillus horti]MDQ0166414.1 hypothetical protein [Bacillus horti]
MKKVKVALLTALLIVLVQSLSMPLASANPHKGYTIYCTNDFSQ